MNNPLFLRINLFLKESFHLKRWKMVKITFNHAARANQKTQRLNDPRVDHDGLVEWPIKWWITGIKNQLINRSTKKPINKCINISTEQLTNLRNNQPTVKATSRLKAQPMDQLLNQLNYRLTTKLTDTLTDQPANHKNQPTNQLMTNKPIN